MPRQSVYLWTAAVVISLTFAGVVSVLDRETSHTPSSLQTTPIAGIESIAWPQPSSRPPATSVSPTNAAPVADLIAGLEQRLATEPDDVKGWVLLAQSYAFVADAHAADAAIAKAVALGFDEADLRQRVDLASQSAAPRMDR